MRKKVGCSKFLEYDAFVETFVAFQQVSKHPGELYSNNGERDKLHKGQFYLYIYEF